MHKWEQQNKKKNIQEKELTNRETFSFCLHLLVCNSLNLFQTVQIFWPLSLQRWKIECQILKGEKKNRSIFAQGEKWNELRLALIRQQSKEIFSQGVNILHASQQQRDRAEQTVCNSCYQWMCLLLWVIDCKMLLEVWRWAAHGPGRGGQKVVDLGPCVIK